MQIKIKESKVVKTGTNKSGDWELIRVTSEDNTEYTTFDKKSKLPSGSVIDFEPVIGEKGKLSFKECAVVSEGQVAISLNDMTPDMWADKQRIERTSIEAQVAYKGIVELMVAQILKPTEGAGKRAIDWAISKLGHEVIPKTKTPDTAQAEKDADELWPKAAEAEKEQSGDLFAWIAENMGWKDSKSAKSWIVNVCKIPEDKIASDPDGVKAEIAQLQGWTI